VVLLEEGHEVLDGLKLLCSKLSPGHEVRPLHANDPRMPGGDGTSEIDIDRLGPFTSDDPDPRLTDREHRALHKITTLKGLPR
jgi:hypothetical protein